MLAGLLRADDGDCEIAGEDSNRGLDYETRRNIGYLAQSFTLFGELTVADNLDFLAGIHQMPPRSIQSVIGFMNSSPCRVGKNPG